MNAPRLLPALGLVALGGALGAVLRASLGLAFPTPVDAFPWVTFAINVSGSVLLAMLTAVPAVQRHSLMRPFLGAGLLGGYTTLSAASEETRTLLAAGQTGLAGAYVLGTLAACLVGVQVVALATAGRRQP